jgi:peptidyl-prolyl cis-trans isomerase SurA
MLCCLLTAAPAFCGTMVNRVAAVVGDDIITSLDVDKLVKAMQAQAAGRGGGELSPDDLRQLREAALDRLIENKIFEAEVKRLGIKASKAEVDAYIRRIKQMNKIDDKAFAAQLSRRGMTPEEYRAQLRRDILKNRLIRRQVKSSIVISDQQVEEYYHKHIDDYRNMDKVRLRALFLNVPRDAPPAEAEAVRKKAQRLRDEAAARKNFAELARKHSQGPGADQGGDLGELAAGDLIPAMRQALGELRPGDVSPVIKAPMGFLIIQLLSRTGSSTVPLAEVKDQIRNKLESQALDKKFQAWLRELKDKTYVKKIK